MPRLSPEPEDEAAAAPASVEAPPYPRPQPRSPASLARARLTGCLGEASCELIGGAADQWKRAAAPGASEGQGKRAQSATKPLSLARAPGGCWETLVQAAGSEAVDGRRGERSTATANPLSLPASGRLSERALWTSSKR